MSPLRDKEIRGLPVFTKSGDRVGKVAGFVIDADRHEVEQYSITKSRLFSALLPDELLVHRSQVIELTSEKMVIEDAVVAERVAEAVMPQPAHAALESGAHTRTAE
jgi:sporulation protein YlmC with PRC-barrel domain